MALMRELYFKKQQGISSSQQTDKSLVGLILERARKIISHPAKPRQTKIKSFLDHPEGELELEESFDENVFLDHAEDLRTEVSEERPFSCAVILDTSSSMAGEKHLLASIAVAVMVLEVPSEKTALIVFSSDGKILKKLSHKESPETTLIHFLKHQPRGFTNIYAGLKETLKEFSSQKQSRKKVGLLATDGKSTEGGDPADLARQFDFLVVFHLCGPGSDLEASKKIAQAGHGFCVEVERFENLPEQLYQILKRLSRQSY